MISCIGARQRGQAIPRLLDTTHPQHSYSLLSRQFTTNPTVSLCARNFRAYDQPCRSCTTCKATDPRDRPPPGRRFRDGPGDPPACGRASCPDPRRSRPKDHRAGESWRATRSDSANKDCGHRNRKEAANVHGHLPFQLVRSVDLIDLQLGLIEFAGTAAHQFAERRAVELR